MGIIFTLAGKDLRILLRDKSSLFWVMFFPLLIALFFGSVFSGGSGGMSGMTIAVIDEDNTDFSAKYIEQLDIMESLNVRPMALDSAVQKVRTGKLTAYVRLKPGFGEHRGLFSQEPLVEVGIDPSRRAESGYLQGMLTQAGFAVLYEYFGNVAAIQKEIARIDADSSAWQGVSAEQRDLFKSFFGNLGNIMQTMEHQPAAADTSGGDTTAAAASLAPDLFAVDIIPVIKDDIGPRSAFEITFPSALLWALIGVAATFAVSIVRERTAGTFLRLRLAPISRFHIIGGKGLACFTTSLTVCIILLAIGYVVFNVRVTNVAILIMGLLATAFCFVGLTMVISVLGKTEESVGGAAWGILLVAAMTGGGMMPVFFMPKWLLTISHFSPVKWGILAIEGGIWRNMSLSEMALPVGVLLGIGAACFTIGTIILTRADS